MSIVQVPAEALALTVDCPRCFASAGVACTRSGGASIVLDPARFQGGLGATLYVCEERLHPSLACDFCGRRGDVRWIAPCRDFELGARDDNGDWHAYRGAWTACQTCGELVGLGARGRLLERALGQLLSRMTRDHDPDVARRATKPLRVALSDQFDLFWSNREGPVRAITAAEVRAFAVEPGHTREQLDAPPQRLAPWYSEQVRAERAGHRRHGAR